MRVRVGQVLQTESRFLSLFLEQSRVVVVGMAEDIPQEGSVWLGSVGGARAGSEGISDAIRGIAVLMDGTFCSSAKQDSMTTRTQPLRLA